MGTKWNVLLVISPDQSQCKNMNGHDHNLLVSYYNDFSGQKRMMELPVHTHKETKTCAHKLVGNKLVKNTNMYYYTNGYTVVFGGTGAPPIK